MAETSRKNIRIKFYPTVMWLVILVLAFGIGVFCAYFHLCSRDDSLSSVVIVKTEDIPQEEVLPADNTGTVGDIGEFLLHHEYFMADTEVLEEVTVVEPLPEAPVMTEIIETDTAPEFRRILDVLPAETPLIAVVIDDMGINKRGTNQIISLRAPLTSSFLTYGKDLEEFAAQARAAGHEIMIHAPMEPKVPANLAPDTLHTGMNEQEIKEAFNRMLHKFSQIPVSGINNHMGSKFTEDEEKLGCIMNILKKHDLFFLDSKTTASSKGRTLAMRNDVNFAARDIFLDNENKYEYIMSQLYKAEQIAAQKGFVIAICHPKSQTYFALKDWLATLPEKNLKLVHVSEVVKAINKLPRTN